MASIGIFEFGGERHEVHLSVQLGSIRIRVRNGEKSWANTFQSHYIEQLTEKTGAFKNFNLFTSILANAISNPGKEKNIYTRLKTEILLTRHSSKWIYVRCDDEKM